MVFSERTPHILLTNFKDIPTVVPYASPKHRKTEAVDGPHISSPRTSLFSDSFCKSFISKTSAQTVLGKGSFGRVMLGEIYGNKVAVKICSQSSCQCIGERNGLLAKHPNIASIYRILCIDFETDIINYITSIGLPLDNFKRFGAQIVVMEFAGRQTLQQLLDDPEEEISGERRMNLVNQIAYGIQFCHDSKIIHLDIKPANVMVMSGDICKLVDFGSSKRSDIEHECNQEFTIGKRAPFGTVIYCAPEIFTNKLVTPKADIYSFGITMWQMMTRTIPFADFEAHSIIYRVINAN
jgi:proto-oncogene serine/threonine-protein kinase mos